MATKTKTKTKRKRKNRKAKPDAETLKAYAYTPGLKAQRWTMVRKERRLPIYGDVYVKEGDDIPYDHIVARALLPGEPAIVKAALTLGLDYEGILPYMLKQIGDAVKQDEIIAKFRAFFGLINRECRAPCDGTIDSISVVSGNVIIQRAPINLEMEAYIPGKVVKVLPNEGAIVEIAGAFIQGAFGISGERHGEVKVLVDSPKEALTAAMITPAHKGLILVGGSLVTLEALRKAVEVCVAGVVVGGVEHDDVCGFIGREVGVAITGEEETGITLIVTEGFGKMAMSQRTFNILKEFEGRMASINGTTQIRAGVIRPEVIIPHSQAQSDSSSKEVLEAGIVPGTLVRIIRNPYFGTIGKVVGLPVTLLKIESESHVRVFDVELEDGQKVTVPRANVEIIEE